MERPHAASRPDRSTIQKPKQDLMSCAACPCRRIAARVTPGAICLSNSSLFPPMLYSAVTKPVALPPGRARLSAKPAPTPEKSPLFKKRGCQSDHPALLPIVCGFESVSQSRPTASAAGNAGEATDHRMEMTPRLLWGCWPQPELPQRAVDPQLGQLLLRAVLAEARTQVGE